MAYSTILFDLDGTLIDTNELILASSEHTFAAHCPGTYTRADVLPIMGEPLADQMRFFDPNQVEAMVATYRQFNESEHDRYVSLFPYVFDCLTQLHQQGITMAVISNKRRKVVEQGLRLFQLDQWMQLVICEGEAGRNKPYPDMLLTALDKLGVSTTEALMVGDSRFDIIAAQRAGVDSVGVAWSLHGEDVQRHQPTYWIEDIRELLPLLRRN